MLNHTIFISQDGKTPCEIALERNNEELGQLLDPANIAKFHVSEELSCKCITCQMSGVSLSGESVVIVRCFLLIEEKKSYFDER